MSDTKMADVPSKVLERIQKLLRTARDARGNQNEAATAASLAQEIASRYNLELSMLEQAGQSDEPLGGKRAKQTHDRAAMYKYQVNLMEAVAKLYFCHHFVVEEHALSNGKMRRVKRHALLGREINVTMATMIYDYLVDTMDRLLPYQGMEKRGKNALLWLEGCSDMLARRLQDKRRAMEKETEAKRREEATRAQHPAAAPSNSLVLSDVYSSEDDFNNDFLYGWEPGTTARNRKEQQARCEARRVEMMEKRKMLAEAGYTGEWLDYLAAGYTEEQVRAMFQQRAEKAAKAAKPETDAQRKKREEREANEQYRYYRKHARQSDPVYRDGVRTGQQIGLNDQVTGHDKPRIG